jgi:hypothetical protein
VGDTEIRKEGMELDQLVQNAYMRDKPAFIQPFDTELLGQAFQLRNSSSRFALCKILSTIPVPILCHWICSLYCLQHLLYQQTEKGIPTISGKPKSECKDTEKKHKKHKDRDRDKDKEHEKHKHRHKDRSKGKDKDKDKDKKKDKSGHHDSAGDHSKKHHDKVGSFSDCYSTKSLSILSNYVPYDGQCPQIVSEEEA